jgi:hypothetical protein
LSFMSSIIRRRSGVVMCSGVEVEWGSSHHGSANAHGRRGGSDDLRGSGSERYLEQPGAQPRRVTADNDVLRSGGSGVS